MIQQKSPEWYELRKRKIGASDAPVILGVSPFKTPYELWLEKMDFSQQPENDAMRFGNEMEPLVRERFYQEMQIPVIPQVCFHGEHTWLMASLDGLSADGKTAVEIKCHRSPTDFNYVKDSGNVPEKYYPQVQVQMEVLDLNRIFYMCFFDNDFHIIEVERDVDFIRDMIPKLRAFYECMLHATPPPLLDKDKEHRSDNEWKNLVAQWLAIDEEITILKERQDMLRTSIIKAANGKSVEGAGIMLTKSVKRGSVDYSLIEELKNMDLDKYRKESKEVWTIRKQKLEE